jgi:CBS domain containing-hemolysin-like protein
LEPLIIGLIISLLLSAFFSGIEIAYFSANKLAIELGKEGSRSGRILSFFANNTSNFIGTLLIGNNIALVIFGIFMADLLEGPLSNVIVSDFLVLMVQTLITTAIVLLFGEFIPKTLFRLYPLGILRFFAVPLRIIYAILWLPVEMIVWNARFLLNNVFRLDYVEQAPDFGKLDLQGFIAQHRDDEQGNTIDADLFENALYLEDVKVRECMVPRPEVQAIDVSAPIDELLGRFIQSGLSRILVYEESLDKVVGYVHHFDLLSRPNDVRDILMGIPVVPETMTARDLLNIFRKEKKNIAWVVDEFGGTAGIVTLEDVTEELFGEIRDEHDEEELLEKQLNENEFIFSARLEVDYLNEKHELGLPEGEYETLAGYIVSKTGSIPSMNEKIELGNFEIHILYASNKRVETIRLIRHPEE